MVHTLARYTAALTLTLFTLPAHAQGPVQRPSPEAVKSTWDYFYRAQGQGPLLVELKLCLEVAKDGPRRFECALEAPAGGIKAGTPVMVWQSYLLPQGDSAEDLTVQVKQGGTIRETRDVTLKGEGWRSRQWVGVRLTKPGAWSISVLRAGQVLRTLDVKVL